MKTIKYSLLFIMLFTSIMNLQSQTDFNNVAKIFYTRCLNCHHDGGSAPFALSNYQEISAYSSSIKSALISGEMPPWRADTTYTRFIGEDIITLPEKNAIINWIDQGIEEGDISLAPIAPVYRKGNVLLGNADLEVDFPNLTSNVSANLPNAYFCVTIPTGLTTDKIIRAFEIVHSNPNIIHHGNVYIDTTGATNIDTSGRCYATPGHLLPIGNTQVFPNASNFKTGMKLNSNYTIYVQTHFREGSRGQSNQTKVRFYFYDDMDTVGIRIPVNTIAFVNWNLPIPANTIRSFSASWDTSKVPASIVAQIRAPKEGTSILAIGAHSHSAGKSMLIHAVKGTDTIKILRINNFNEHFQYLHHFKKPLYIPNDYTCYSTHVYDNTINNPNLFNKNPIKNIVGGPGQADEMLFDAMLFLPYRTGDENINLDSIMKLDTLMSTITSIEDKWLSVPAFKSYVYPNPASNKVSIYVSNKSINKCTIINFLGERVAETEMFTEKVSIDVKQLPSGIYVVEVIDTINGRKTTNKLIISH